MLVGTRGTSGLNNKKYIQAAMRPDCTLASSLSLYNLLQPAQKPNLYPVREDTNRGNARVREDRETWGQAGAMLVGTRGTSGLNNKKYIQAAMRPDCTLASSLSLYNLLQPAQKPNL